GAKCQKVDLNTDFCRTRNRIHRVVSASAVIARAVRISRHKPGRSSIFRWKAGSAKRFKLSSRTVEECCRRNSRSGRTDFAPSSSIPKEIASHFIHPRFNIGSMGDPRNVAHAKKVIQEKHHKGSEVAKGAAPT